MKTLKIFKSSAGSGKTFTLVIEFLKIVLKYPEDYKAVLAITFTNKAAEEMKNRIIEALVSLSNGEESSIRTILEDELTKTDLTAQAGKALKNILHDYSSFSISTIDSFFQRILRALAKEINLPLTMEVQVELDDAILEVTDSLLKEVGVDKELTDWLTNLALQKIDDDKGWNLEKDISSVVKELFKEEHHNRKTLTREEIHTHYKNLKKTKKEFEIKLKEFGERSLKEISDNGFSVSDFSYGSSGAAGYFEKICNPSDPDNFKPKTRVLEALSDPDKWAAKKSPVRITLVGLAEKSLINHLGEIIDYVEINLKNYLTACEIFKKIYLFGIVNDLQKKLTAYRNENNIILLADTTRLLNDVIDGNDAPFLFEKTGNRYKHLLIDEFQDTSLLQWKNLLPLIINALGSGFMTLIVGDAKQSIYRWRGGNMNLLLHDLFKDLDQFKSMLKEEVLMMNYRSKRNIVDFNNDFFSKAPILIGDQLGSNGNHPVKVAYDKDLVQGTYNKNGKGGYVKINFLENTDGIDGEKIKWKQNSLDELLKTINDLQSKNFKLKDICILVRRNNEGSEIANFLFQNGITNIISPDSLLITASPRIEFVVNVLRFLSDNSNDIARSEIIYFYRRFISKKNDDNLHELFSDHKNNGIKRKSNKPKPAALFEGLEDNLFNRILPEAFTSNLSNLAKLPVYELSEHLISIFNLNETADAYIQRFQDLVLEYTSKSNSSLNGFLEWWDVSNNVSKASVMIPENTNAIRIMTAHSAKGLQFPVVIMPFCDWPILPKANELMWMDTKDSPFKELGIVALTSGSRLKETYFKEEYEEEINQTVIDNLNLLYVAFTRAEERLYVSSPVDNEKDLNSIAKLIYRTCKLIDSGFNDSVYEKGIDEIYNSEGRKEKKFTPHPLTSYISSRWQEKLALSTHSTDLLSLLENRQMTKINYGILVHSVLAGIKKLSEIDSVVDQIVFDGLIGEDERSYLKKEISEVLAIPEIKKFFDESYTVRAERELILPDGEILRPDRVIIKDNCATIIDFKTGKREKKHEKQVSQYADALRKMSYKNVDSVLIYIAERVVIAI